MTNLDRNTQDVNNECDSCLTDDNYDPWDEVVKKIEARDAQWKKGLAEEGYEVIDNVIPLRSCLDAAIAYAKERGWKTFPADCEEKKSYLSAKYAPGGERWGQTKDLEQLKINFSNPKWRLQAGVGLPTGAGNGIIVIETDTIEGGHKHSGLPHLKALEAKLGPLPATLMGMSPSSSLHQYFGDPGPGYYIQSQSGIVPGVDVKGEGGMVIAPPSVRGSGIYRWVLDYPIAELPPAWRDYLSTPKPKQTATSQRSRETVDLEELSEMVSFIPNCTETDYDEYKAMALRIWASIDDEEDGFTVFTEWSCRWPLYDPMLGPSDDRQCWEQVCGSPPDHTGIFVLRKMAREAGWVPKQQIVEPTYQLDYSALSVGEVVIRHRVRQFLWEHVHPEREIDPDKPWPVCWAMLIDTAVGKTEIVIEELALFLQQVTLNGPIIYTVPQHKLGEEILERFAKRGINARIFRGRTAIDPDKFDPTLLDKDQKLMCLRNDNALKMGMATHVELTETCCVKGKIKCPLIDKCGYFGQQQDAKEVQVWIVAADTLFHTHKVFGKPAAVFIDEGIWQKGLRLNTDDEEQNWLLPIDSLLKSTGDGRHDQLRRKLAETLHAQPTNGNLQTQHLWTLMSDEVREAINCEWKLIGRLVKEIGQHPHMTDNQIDQLLHDKHDVIDEIQVAHRVKTIWEEVHVLLRPSSDIDVSGRLILRQKKGLRQINWQGVAKIKRQYWKATLMFDAVLPDLPLLQVHQPQAEITDRVHVKMPEHTHIRQILNAPSTSIKLDNKKHCREMYRYIMQRWMELGRQKTLVVCQMKLEKYLEKECGFQRDDQLIGHGNIHVLHFNNLRGLNAYEDVRLEIVIGGTAPGPRIMENMAGVLLGAKPDPVVPPGPGFVWYTPPVKRGIGLVNGLGIEVEGDLHLAPFVEIVRWQVREGEQLQAIGRARGLRRTEANPVAIDLLFDDCLPILINAVTDWNMVKPSLLIETAVEGVMLTSPGDMVKLWDHLWPNLKAAERTLEKGVPELPGFVPVTYQLVRPKMKRRLGHFHLAAIPDPKAWLTERLGPITTTKSL